MTQNYPELSPSRLPRVYLQGTEAVDVLSQFLIFVAFFLLLLFFFLVALKLEGITDWCWRIVFMPLDSYFLFFGAVLLIYLLARSSDSIKIWDSVC
jgi:hypothetical protein